MTITVEWAGTSPTTGRFSIPRETSESEFLTYLTELTARGEGYLEVNLPGRAYPCLALSFRGNHAVIHSWTDEATTALLIGDSSMPADATIVVPVYDEPALFGGAVTSTQARAWDVIQTFIRTGEIDTLGEWWNL